MVPPHGYEKEQFVEEMKSREPTRSKSHEAMRSDWTTPRGYKLGQVKSKSFQVPHHRRTEGAAILQRPGVSTSSTPMESPEESPALYTILACLFLWLLFAQAEAPCHVAAMALACYAVFPSVCAVAAASQYALWAACKEAGEAILSSFAWPSAASLLCLVPAASCAASCNMVGTSLLSAPAAMEALAAPVASDNGSRGATMRVDMLCADHWGGMGSTHSLWFPLHKPPPSQTPTNSTLSALSLCACGGEQTSLVRTLAQMLPREQLFPEQTSLVRTLAQMLPREQLLIARLCPSRFTPVQWNRLCRCYWGNTSAPLHPGSHLPLSRLYTVRKPPVVRTQEQLQAALQQMGAALVKTGDFLGPEVEPTARSSRAAARGAGLKPSLNKIRDGSNTSWVAITNKGSGDSGPRLRKVSLTSKDNWQKAGATWLEEALHPLGLEAGDACVGPRIYQPAGLMRLQGVACQLWHGDAAEVNSLQLRDSNDFDALPFSALHPLSPGGTTILIVPIDTRTPSQVFVPPGFVLIWRGDLEHAGDEFLGSENLALFTYILPPTILFRMECDKDGASLTFGTGRKHSSLELPFEFRGCDQGAGVGPIGYLATFDAPSDSRIPDSRIQRTLQAPAIHNGSNETSTTRPGVAALDVPASAPATSSGTASPCPSPSSPAVGPETAATACEQLDAFLANMNTEYGQSAVYTQHEYSAPPSPQAPPPPVAGVHACGGDPACSWASEWTPASPQREYSAPPRPQAPPPPAAGVHACGGDPACSWASEWTPTNLRDNGMGGQQHATDIPRGWDELPLAFATDIPRCWEELPLACATCTDPPPPVDDAASDHSQPQVFMDTSLGADVPLTAAQSFQLAQEEGLVLSKSSSSTSGYTNVRQLRDGRRESRPYRAEMRMGQPGAKWHIGTFSTPEEAALQVARARAQALLNDDPLLCREEPEELTTGLSGTAVPLQQASVAARPAELTAESSGTASPVQQATELTAESSGTASSVQQATELTAESSGTASSVQQATGANATPVPSSPPFELATSLSRPRGMHKTLYTPIPANVSLPGPSNSNDNDLLDRRALAASQMVLKADQGMDQRVLGRLHGMQAARIEVCSRVLSQCKTLVYGESMSGYAQVRVMGDLDGDGSLKFQAQSVIANKTTHGETYLLPELAAAELAEPLMPAPPASAPAMAYADAALKAQAQRAIDAAATDGLYLPVDQGMTGFRGVILNANKGQGKPPRKMPYRARLTEVAKPCKRILGSWFGTAEEAALDRAKMLKSHPGKYKDP